MSKSKKALVTGASGFVGANLVRLLLKSGYQTHIILRPEAKTWRLDNIKEKFVVHEGNFLDSDWLKKIFQSIKPDYIFHLAQYGGYPSQNDTGKNFETNLSSTIKLLAAAKKTGFEKFIYAGSSSEYGKKNKPMKETDLLEPVTDYAVSKASASLYLESKWREEKLPVTVLRLFSVYGPFEEPGRLIPTILLRYLDNEKLELASPEIARDFVYIDDVTEAFLKAAETKNANGKIINVGCGKQTTLKEVARVVSRIAKKNIPIIWNKTKGRSFDTDKWLADTKRSKNLLNWTAKTDFETGLRKTLLWIEKNKKYYAN